MANKELDQMRSILSNLDSEATSKPQPSKNMNGGSAKIDGANPTSPSTNPATRREEYSNYIKTLNKDQQQSLYNEVLWYKNQGMSNDQIYDKVLWNSTTTPDIKEAPTTTGVDLTIKGNFDLYNPVDWQNQPEMMQQYYVQANNDIKSSRRALSKLMLQQDALSSKSGNVEQVTTLIDAIENAYDRGVFDTETIANTLWVPAETVSLIQQGKANELVTLNQEFVEDELKSFYRAEEDYNTNLQRTMEDFNLAKTNLDRQYNSAMQTLKRNLFDDKRAASVGSAVAGISGSEYAVRVIEAKHQQNMDDLEWNYLYSSIQQKYSYTRAIEDYNKNIQRLSEDFDDSLKDIQASVLQQFQEIDNKIGLTTEQLAKAYGTLQQNVLAAKSTATTNYLEALSKNENGLANAIANTYWLDQWDLTTQKFGESIRTWDTVWNDVNSIWHILNSNDWLRIGTYTNSKWYTYNVYATREDGLKATIQLLKRWYYWMSLADAAQKWIGQWKDISVAKSVMARNWLKLTDKLSDANVEKFIQAMGQWEWTLKNGKTLDEWLKEWRILGTSPTATTTTEWWDWKYRETDEWLYKKQLEAKLTDSDKKTIKSDPYYWNTEQERWDNFMNATNTYKQEQVKWDISQIKSSRDLIEDARNSFVNATKWMTDNEIRNAYSAYKEYVKKVENWEAVNIKSLAIAKYLDDNPDLLTAFAQFDQVLAQWFIDTIISSKQHWATYWPLSDNEWRSLRQAYTSVNMLQWRKNIIAWMDKMINNLTTNMKELWWEEASKQEQWKAFQQRQTRILTSITNPSAQTANDIFSNPWRAAPMSTATNSALTWVYQTMMPK